MSTETIATPHELERVLADIPDKINDKGRELCLQIAPAIAGRYEATRPGTQKVCSEICREATKLQQWAELLCEGGELEDRYGPNVRAELEQKQDAARERVARLVRVLPAWIEDSDRIAYDSDDSSTGEIERNALLHSWGVDFGGDPRGVVVKLTGPREVYDSFGGDGVCVPVR